MSVRSMRVIVVSHQAINSPLKVFKYDDGDGWDRAREWVDNSTYSDEMTNVSSARVH